MLVRILFVAIVSLAAPMTAAPASAQDILPVPWAERQPTIADYRSTYPQQALRDGLEGQVRLACTLTEDRALDCAVQSETPAGAGFGDAALQLSRLYIVRADYGLQPGARVILPVRYVLGD